MLHISQVVSGLACKCLCPGCGDDLVARKGTEVAHHFAHHAVGDCRFTPESALHLYAKQLVAAQPTFRTPKLREVPENVARVTEAWLERAIGDVVPDVQLATDTGLLLAEVWVTNAVNDNKRRKLRRIQVPAVEIDLADLSGDEALAAIDFAVLEDIERRSWLYHPLLEEMERHRTGPTVEDRVRKDDEGAEGAKREADARAAEERAIALAHEEYLDSQELAGLQLIGQACGVDADEVDLMLRAAPEHDRTRLYGLLEPVEKLAYHCFLLGCSGRQLPRWWNERLSDRNPFVDPSIVWRTGVLLKFAAGNKPFSVSDVVAWCSERYPKHDFAQELADAHGAEWDASEISKLELAVFQFLDQLEHDGYVDSDGWIPRLRRYTSTGRFRPTIRRRR